MASGWTARLADRAGPLLAAAEAFMARHGDLPSGPAGLRGLCHILERADPASEEQERQLVEGAGAMLGLLLLAHVDEGRHRARDGQHRLQVGARGFFDPFAAIEAALASNDRRGELARQVSLAEAEAAGEGTVARAALAFEGALARTRPDLSIQDQFERTLTLSDGAEIALDRVARVAEGGDAPSVGSAAQRLVSLLPGSPDAPTALAWEEVCDVLLPRLIPDGFLADLGDPSPLCTARLGHDVHVALVALMGDRARYLRGDEVEAWGMTPGEARRLAVRNLATRSTKAVLAHGEMREGPLVAARTGDGLDAARLVLPGLYDVLAAELPPPVVAAVPHRDTLLATTAQRPEAVEALRRRAIDARARAPHGISDQLFEVTEAGVSAWVPPD
jgi:hypothetical protein